MKRLRDTDSMVLTQYCLLRLGRCRSRCRPGRRGGLFYFALAIAGVTVKSPGRREFAELMTDHILGAVHRDELMPVMDCEGQRDHVRRDHRAARPGLDDSLVAAGGRGADFLEQMPI